jgi:hypothetical protein
MMNELTSKYGRFMTGLGCRVQELPQFSDGSKEEEDLIARSLLSGNSGTQSSAI